MTQLGQHPDPRHCIVHISDTHFTAGRQPLYGSIDTDGHLAQALKQVEQSGARVEALVFTGDLADTGRVGAYARLRALVQPVAERLGAELIWVMGNHDDRADYAAVLFDDEPGDRPQDRVYDLNGLRIISLDTTVPGFHHGDLDDTQLEWLAETLRTPATDGTLLALHHPPIPTPRLEVMGVLELRHQQRLADVIRGTDVRAVLGGHLHYSTHSTFAGIPVSVAAATCYTMDVSAPGRLLCGVDSGQSINFVHLYDDQVVHSIVPIGPSPEVTGVSDEYLTQIKGMTPDQRTAMFSDKSSSFNRSPTP